MWINLENNSFALSLFPFSTNFFLGALEDFDSKAPLATKHSSQTDSENGGKLSDSSKNPCNSRKSTLKTEGSSSASASSQQTTDHARSGVDFSQVAGLEDLENAMKSILGDEPELLAQLEQFAQAAASAEPGKMFKHLLHPF